MKYFPWILPLVVFSLSALATENKSCVNYLINNDVLEEYTRLKQTINELETQSESRIQRYVEAHWARHRLVSPGIEHYLWSCQEVQKMAIPCNDRMIYQAIRPDLVRKYKFDFVPPEYKLVFSALNDARNFVLGMLHEISSQKRGANRVWENFAVELNFSNARLVLIRENGNQSRFLLINDSDGGAVIFTLEEFFDAREFTFDSITGVRISLGS